jgi:hypothetical protein
MPFIAAFTAAEAAAAVAAAEAAAVTAAQVAAAEAAAATAAQAATATAAETAIAAVPEALSATSFAPQAGILEAMPGQLQNIQNLASSPGIQVAGLDPSVALNAFPTAGAKVSTIAGAAPTNIAGAGPATIAGELTPLAQTTVNPSGITGVTASAPPPVAAQPTVADFARAGIDPASMVQPPSSGILQAAPAQTPMSFDTFGNPVPAGSPAATMADPTGLAQAQLEASAATAPQPTQPTAFDKFSQFAKENKFLTGAGAYLTALRTGMLDQEGASMPERKSYGPQYRLSKDFQAATPAPNVYTPSYPQYAEGGVMTIDGPEDQMPTTRMEDGDAPGYAKGGTLSDSLDFYKQMIEARPSKGATAPKADADVGIYYDQDPDTRYQDALTAAQIRQAKLNKRSNLQVPTGGAMRRPTPMGQINLAPPGAKEAAQGGIMQAGNSSLGGYAAGGNPRLLKGPGDGMSDNIPAMIGRKQPARLADGEFVIPADVVSHLGNGSTEAGAKRLHEMMNNVRRARTGNPKQGKQINPRKYMPK